MNVNRKIPLRRFQRCYFVYIVASLRGTLYVGLTDELRKRIRQHKEGTFDGFTRKYKVNRLMYFETYSDSKFAEHREKQMKKYGREKKIALFKESNPGWRDLYPELFVSIGIARYGPGFSSSSKRISAGSDPSLRSGFQKKAAYFKTKPSRATDS